MGKFSETLPASSQSPWRSRKICPLSSTVPSRAYGLEVTTPSQYPCIQFVYLLPILFTCPEALCDRSVPPLGVAFLCGWLGWWGVDYDVRPAHTTPRPTTHQVTLIQPPHSNNHIHRGEEGDGHRLPFQFFYCVLFFFLFPFLPSSPLVARCSLCWLWRL